MVKVVGFWLSSYFPIAVLPIYTYFLFCRDFVSPKRLSFYVYIILLGGWSSGENAA